MYFYLITFVMSLIFSFSFCCYPIFKDIHCIVISYFIVYYHRLQKKQKTAFKSVCRNLWVSSLASILCIILFISIVVSFYEHAVVERVFNIGNQINTTHHNGLSSFVCMYVCVYVSVVVFSFITTRVGGIRSGTVVGGSPDASFWFYLREAFQSQTNTEKILYSKSR